jgi:hypothetical protein
MNDGAPSNIRVGQIFNRSFTVLSGNFGKFFILALVVWLPFLLFAILLVFTFSLSGSRSLIHTAVMSLVLFLAAALLVVLSQATLLYGAIQKMRGEEFGIGESLGRGFARFFPILGMLICAGLGAGLASLVFLVPGVVLAVAWYVALPACIIEKLGPIASLRRSAYLTKGNRWRIFGIALIIGGVSIVVQFALFPLLAVVVGHTASAIGSFIWMALFQAFSSVVIAVLYHDLRVAREGVDINQIAAVFD